MVSPDKRVRQDGMAWWFVHLNFFPKHPHFGRNLPLPISVVLRASGHQFIQQTSKRYQAYASVCNAPPALLSFSRYRTSFDFPPPYNTSAYNDDNITFPVIVRLYKRNTAPSSARESVMPVTPTKLSPMALDAPAMTGNWFTRDTPAAVPFVPLELSLLLLLLLSMTGTTVATAISVTTTSGPAAVATATGIVRVTVLAPLGPHAEHVSM